MKPLFAVLWQAIVLYLAAFTGFVAGMTVPSFRVSHVLSHSDGVLRTYDFSWLIAVMLMYILLLAVSAFRGRLRTNWPATTIAFAVTITAVLLFTRFGIKETVL